MDPNVDLGGRYPGWTTHTLAAQMRSEGLDIPLDITPDILLSFADAYYVENTPPPPPSMRHRYSVSSAESAGARIQFVERAEGVPNQVDDNASVGSRMSRNSAAFRRSARGYSQVRGYQGFDDNVSLHSEQPNPARQPMSQRQSQRLSARSYDPVSPQADVRSQTSSVSGDASSMAARRRALRAQQRKQRTLEGELRLSTRRPVVPDTQQEMQRVDYLPDPEIEFGKPTKKAALEYARDHQARKADGEPFGCCSSTTGRFCAPQLSACDVCKEGHTSDFARFGPGISIHFKFIKWLMWVFFILSVLTTPQTILNSLGPSGGDNDGGGIFITTFGNLFDPAVVSNRFNTTTWSETEEKAYNDDPLVVLPGIKCDGNETCVITRNELAVAYVTIDAICSVVVIIALLWLRYSLHLEEHDITKSHVTTAQYTVQVSRVPPGSGEMAIARFFNDHIRDDVADVALGKDNGELIDLYMERGEALVELWRAAGFVRQMYDKNKSDLAVARNNRRVRNVQLKLREAVRYYDQVYARFVAINEMRHERNPGTKSITAFVTFKSREGYELCLDRFGKKSLLSCRRRRRLHTTRELRELQGLNVQGSSRFDTDMYDVPPSKAKLQGYPMKAKPAPPPSTILWENLEYGRCSRLFRQILGTFVVVLAVTGSVAATYGAQAYRGELSQALGSLGDSVLCQEVIERTNVTSIGSQSDLIDRIDLLVASGGTSDETECLCALLSFSRAVRSLFDPDSSCHDFFLDIAPLYGFTSMATGVIAVVNVVCGAIIRSLTNWERHHSIVSRELSVGIRLFVVYLVNTGFVLLLVNARLDGLGGSSFFGTGLYDDFSSDWYSNVGEQITITMLLNVFIPHISRLSSLVFSTMSAKFSKPIVQREMNELYVGPEFELAMRTAQLMMTATVALMYGGGIPMLYPVAFVSFFLYYWVDKYLLIRFYRRPPEYDTRLSRWSVLLLTLGLCLHLGFTAWMFTVPGIFSGPVQQESILQRVMVAHASPLVLLLAVALGIPLLARVMRSIVGCRGKLKNMMEEDMDLSGELPLLEEAIESGALRGLQTYNILHNPKYARAFGVTAGFADQHKHVDDVRELPDHQIPKIQPEIRLTGIM